RLHPDGRGDARVARPETAELTMTRSPLLDVDELSVAFARRRRRDVQAVDRISFSLREGRITGLVGESGCGKSVTSLALMGLLPARGVRVGGTARFRLGGGDEVDLLALPAARLDRKSTRLNSSHVKL